VKTIIEIPEYFNNINADDLEHEIIAMLADIYSSVSTDADEDWYLRRLARALESGDWRIAIFGVTPVYPGRSWPRRHVPLRRSRVIHEPGRLVEVDWGFYGMLE